MTTVNYLLPIVFIACSTTPPGVADGAGRAPADRAPSGAILGQSNAVGTGTDLARTRVTDVLWREHTEIFFTNELVERDWGDLRTRPGGKFGPEFGIAAVAPPDLTLEKFAIGSTPLAPGGDRPAWLPSAGEIYPRALAFLASGPLPDFVFWWQGETDAADLEKARAYGENLAALSTALREDLGAPALVFIAGRVRADSPQAYAAEERASLEGWESSANLLLDVDDVPVGADGLHYGNLALDEVGRRVWAAYSAKGLQ